MWTAKQLRQKYLEFFKNRQHQIIASASLIPENDPTVLFTTAGMHPLTPFLLGERHPQGNRLTDVQKCVRTRDIEEVGDLSHLTFFEMLGNWSLGDPSAPNGIGQASYFKEEAITWAWNFCITKEGLSLDKEKLSVTIFGGDKRYSNLKPDLESIKIWKKMGIPSNRIAQITGGVVERENNWWGPAGLTGPCGPCTEIYYWIGESKYPPEQSNVANDPNNWLEIWNIVLMEYNKTINNKFESLKQKNIDTGMGLERTLLVLNDLVDVYQIDTLWSLVQKIEEISGCEYVGGAEITKAMRIIADHIRSAVMIMGDQRGVAPSNTDQGYIVRRLIRRAIRQGHILNIKENFCSQLAEKVIKIFSDIYPELLKNKEFILTEIGKEESKFRNTLEKGLKKIKQLINQRKKNDKNVTAIKNKVDFGSKTEDYVNMLSGKDAFDLYQSYGFPPEILEEELAKEFMTYNKEEFKQEMQKHQEISRAGAANKFKGGLADNSEMSKKYHTATHLLQAALRQVLGKHVEQKGSNINTDRLRFDFSHPEKLTQEQKEQVENLVNIAINNDYPVSYQEMTVEEAKQKQAIGLFENKYGVKVKVYTIGDPQQIPTAKADSSTFSREICGGPHVKHTGILGKFKIKKEKASSAGIRRIKAILE